MLKDPNIQEELSALGSSLVNISKSNVYTIPEGYFDVVPFTILQTLKQDVQKIPGNSSIPEGYFDGLAASIMEKIRLDTDAETGTSELLQSLKTRETFRVPQNYFDGLAAGVMKQIASEAETGERSELLEQVRHINPYSVPQDYFDTFAAGISMKLQPAKVLVMTKRVSIFKYAIAAVITGMLGLSVISIIDKKQQDMVMPLSGTVMEEASAIIKNNGFEKALSDLSDSEIEKYLKASGEDVDAALVASASEDKNLPDELDYITNDQTLDNLLKELNIKDQSVNN